MAGGRPLDSPPLPTLGPPLRGADPVPPAAETQGLTERYIGSWLKAGGAKREDVVLATKVLGAWACAGHCLLFI